MASQRPRHEDMKHHGFKTEVGQHGSGLIYSDTETWCGHCQKWVQTPGVTGQLRYMAEHRDGDCVGKGQP